MIWTRELNGSLKNYIETLTKNITNHYGKHLDVNVIIRYPNIELVEEKFPTISINNLGYSENLAMTDVNSFSITYGEKTSTKKRKESKYTFSFQIDFWANSPIDMDAMTEVWILNNPKHQMIPIKDSEGNLVMCNFTQRGDMQTLNFLDDKGKFVYRNVVVCDILIGVDNHKEVVLPTVSDVNTNINK